MNRLLVTLFLTACTARPTAIHAFVSGPDGFDTASYWVDSGSEVVVFDAQFTPELAESLLAEIRAATSSPIAYVVVTHPNPDKFNGATVFQREGATLVASRATAAAMPGVQAYKEAYFVDAGTFPEGGYPSLPSVDTTFDGQLRLALDGGTDVVLVELDHAGVSSTQTVAIVDGKDVIVGDLVAGEAHAWLEGGIVDGSPRPDIDGWIAALDELRERIGDDAIVHPGRGTAGPAGTVIPAEQDYLRAMDAQVADYVGGLTDPAATLAADPATHWAAITAEAEDAYPSYRLSYLVTYGVYGLAFAHAAE